jgi:Leucine-rich repeat (LRR) protein
MGDGVGEHLSQGLLNLLGISPPGVACGLSPRKGRTIDINGTDARCLVRSVLAKHRPATLAGLQELHAASNDIVRVDAVVCTTMRSLRILCLSANKLRMLPAEIGLMRSLRMLQLEGNQLRSLPWQIGELCSLEQLWLGCNELVELPESIGSLHDLRELWVVSNRLRALPASVGALSRLERLELSHNLLTELPDSLVELHRLQDFWVRNNVLSEVPTCLVPGPGALKTLDLSSNQLERVPVALADRPALCMLRLEGNTALQFPNAETIALGPAAVLAALRALAKVEAEDLVGDSQGEKMVYEEEEETAEEQRPRLPQPEQARDGRSNGSVLGVAAVVQGLGERAREAAVQAMAAVQSHPIPPSEPPPSICTPRRQLRVSPPTTPPRASLARSNSSGGSPSSGELPSTSALLSPVSTTSPRGSPIGSMGFVDAARWQRWVAEDATEAERIRARYGLRISSPPHSPNSYGGRAEGSVDGSADRADAPRSPGAQSPQMRLQAAPSIHEARRFFARADAEAAVSCGHLAIARTPPRGPLVTAASHSPTATLSASIATTPPRLATTATSATASPAASAANAQPGLSPSQTSETFVASTMAATAATAASAADVLVDQLPTMMSVVQRAAAFVAQGKAKGDGPGDRRASEGASASPDGAKDKASLRGSPSLERLLATSSRF